MEWGNHHKEEYEMSGNNNKTKEGRSLESCESKLSTDKSTSKYGNRKIMVKKIKGRKR